MEKAMQFISLDKAGRTEKIIRKFLLDKSDIIRLDGIGWTELGFFRIKRFGNEKDPLFVEVLNRLKPFFIRKATDNKRFGDIAQGKRARFTHYYYRLSPEIKSLINKESLRWYSAPPYSKAFYSFEDPAFYKKGRMIACVISHEYEIMLYLDRKEKKELEEKGVKFEYAC